jgi:PAS domain S-box-containing protein
VVYFNERWEEKIGDREGSMGWNWTKRVHPDDVQKCTETWRAAIRDGACYEHKLRIQLRDGDYRWFLARAYPVKDRNGKVVQWFGTSADIHDYMTDREELFE